MRARKTERGFTLVEIAIVLVIIGLLLGGILKGQELIVSAQVRNIADQNSGVQAAYYGFIDRYQQIPGDWRKTPAGLAIPGVQHGGNGNGRLDKAGSEWTEPLALWEHLSKSGFIQGNYTGESSGGSAPSADDPTVAPRNAFNGLLVLYRTDDYLDTDPSPTIKQNLVLGRNIPVNVLRELDVKIDDGLPQSGVLRHAVSSGAVLGAAAESAADCVDNSTPPIWNIAADSQECNAVYLY